MSHPDPAPPRRVAVLGLGGTIAMTPTGDGGATPALSAADLIAAVPGLAETSIIVETVEVARLPGASLDFARLAATAATARKQIEAGASGAVVVQGTDTIEETAYLLDLLHDRPEPLVVTGAMRHPGLAGADGPANLLAAITTAAHPDARGQGVLVVISDEIHAARRVRKTHTSSPATFCSPDSGPLGRVVEGTPVLLSRLAARNVLPLADDVTWPQVGLLTITLGDDGRRWPALAEGYDGLVVAAFGAGHVPEATVPALADLARRLPVVLASRTGAGPVLSNTYGFPGSESDLLARGLIRAGFLDPYKARILLTVLLATTRDRDTITSAFAAAGGYADPDTWPWPPSQTTGFTVERDADARS
ncbi:asparaginase [Natronosporangium hydrolyticum]|uniref:Asparaginase n=1 Tax=Natronosporangium hydrolyticum TaxID=2811111 RepID=A0A895YDA7_9ACTN|nr:asparaginase [Natronosporangium hydrolyticum]QSB14185.1 asparaginase [Natronosporangium hydrolyticum]